MRTPLPIRASGKVSSNAVYVMQALHLLDLTSEDRLLNAGHAVDQSDRRTVAVVRTMLEYGARVQSISPIVPEKILGDDGLQHRNASLVERRELVRAARRSEGRCGDDQLRPQARHGCAQEGRRL